MRFASVSEPTLVMFPETPAAFVYSGSAGSTPSAAAAGSATRATHADRMMDRTFTCVLRPGTRRASWNAHVTSPLTNCDRCKTGRQPEAEAAPVLTSTRCGG